MGWIKYDLDLIRGALKEDMNNDTLHKLLEDCPLMKNLKDSIQDLLDYGLDVSIISGGMHPVVIGLLRILLLIVSGFKIWRYR